MSGAKRLVVWEWDTENGELFGLEVDWLNFCTYISPGSRRASGPVGQSATAPDLAHLFAAASRLAG